MKKQTLGSLIFVTLMTVFVMYQLCKRTNCAMTAIFRQNNRSILIEQKRGFHNVYSQLKGKWHKNINVSTGYSNFRKSVLVTPHGKTPIYIFKKGDLISDEIQSFGLFDKNKAHNVLKILHANPSVNLIDIGSNVGQYSLSAALLGRKAIAIDSLNLNLQHLYASVRAGNFEKNIMIIHNAVDEKPGENVQLIVDRGNIGGTFVDHLADQVKAVKRYKDPKKKSTQNAFNATTITLDDLLKLEEINEFRNVFIKIDVEGFEERALRGATQFFEFVKVQGLYMEWTFHRKFQSGNRIAQFLMKRKYKPYTEDHSQMLSTDNTSTWPLDVIWVLDTLNFSKN